MAIPEEKYDKIINELMLYGIKNIRSKTGNKDSNIHFYYEKVKDALILQTPFKYSSGMQVRFFLSLNNNQTPFLFQSINRIFEPNLLHIYGRSVDILCKAFGFIYDKTLGIIQSRTDQNLYDSIQQMIQLLMGIDAQVRIREQEGLNASRDHKRIVPYRKPAVRKRVTTPSKEVTS